MELKVQRQEYDDQSTRGEMLIDSQHFAWTLEPRKDQSQGKPYAIPAGTYQVLTSWSQHFSMVIPVVVNVPGFNGVEIHPGNYPVDTHGCCLVGYTESKDFVGQSRQAFEDLMDRLNGTTENTITYVDKEGVNVTT
jgi:hypothetical protein